MTETPVLIPWAPGAQYTKVICRLGEPRPDDSDVDEYPDLMTQGGTVTITCAAKKIRYSEPDGGARMLTTRPWTFRARPSDGELYNPESDAVGVYVLSGSSAGVDPAGFTWSATVTPDNGESWTVTIPADAGTTVDLVSIVDIAIPSAGESTLSARVAALEASSGGGGAVSSVAGRTGDVVLSSADLTDAASLATDAELTSGLAGKANATHTHAPEDIADWAEAVQDTVAAMLVSGANVTLTYDDASGKVTVTAVGEDAEVMRDTIGAALVGVGGVSISINDEADTITLSISGVNSTQISDSTATGRSLVAAADAAAAREAIGAAPATQPINAQTGTTYTLAASDAGKLVTLANAAAITLTVPASTFTAGQRVDVLVTGAGMVTATAGSGLTLNGTPTLVSRAQWSAFTVLFTSATAAVVVGDLASA